LGVKADANSNRDESAKGAVYSGAEFDPLLRRFGPGGREGEQNQQSHRKQF
jgi:hypothetical protein